MEYTDKILQFGSLDELKTAVRDDLDSRDVLAQRYSVRFLMLNNFGDYRAMFKYLTNELGIPSYDLSKLALGEDKTITSDMLLQTINQLDSSHILTPISELIRFYSQDKFRGFLNEIILHEDVHHPHKRIYIPIIGLHNRFTDFLKNFGRIAESAPIWQYYTTDDKVLVYITDQENLQIVDCEHLHVIHNMREWLDFWKNMAPVDKLLCGSGPIKSSYMHSRPDSIFTFLPLKNAQEIMTDFLGVCIPFSYQPDDEAHWNNLLRLISGIDPNSFHFSTTVLNHFNRVKIDAEAFLDLWADHHKQAFDRWLLKQYVLHSTVLDQCPYTRLCLKETSELNSPLDLFIQLASRIFHHITPTDQASYAEERKMLMQKHRDTFRDMLSDEQQNSIANDIRAMVKHGNNFAQVKRLCTATFDFEKVLFMGWYVHRRDNGFGLEQVKVNYPDLYDYLQPIETIGLLTSQHWASIYMQDYKQAKLADQLSTEVQETIAKKNASSKTFFDWFYAFEDEHELLANARLSKGNRPDRVYWIDALGVEFMPYILNLLERTSYQATVAKMARTGLPSETELNDFRGDDVFKLGGLDKFIHEQHYRGYETLVKELDLIRKFIEKIVADNSLQNHTIAIVSDHGLSALSRLAEPAQVSKNAGHEGRYIPLGEGKENYVDEPEFIVVHNENNQQRYKVALTHRSLKNKPSHEVHGGATPEEVLVPFLLITNNPEAKPVEYKVQLLTERIKLSNPKLSLDITPVPDAVCIKVGDKEYDMLKAIYWDFSVPDLMEGKLQFTVLPDRGKPVAFEVTVDGMGFNPTDDFDDF